MYVNIGVLFPFHHKTYGPNYEYFLGILFRVPALQLQFYGQNFVFSAAKTHSSYGTLISQFQKGTNYHSLFYIIISITMAAFLTYSFQYKQTLAVLSKLNELVRQVALPSDLPTNKFTYERNKYEIVIKRLLQYILFVGYCNKYEHVGLAQLTSFCSKSARETLEQVVKSLQN